MKPRTQLIIASVGLLVTTVAMVGKQRQQLHELRGQVRSVQSQVETATNAAAPESASSESATPATHSGPSLELLRLRSQVGQLERRKRELAGVSAEHRRLLIELATKPAGSQGSGALPAGYIRRAEAKNLGFNSPENALQSFLWGIEHRDLPTVMQFCGPKEAKEIAARVERDGSDAFWKEAGVVPGLHVTDRKQKDDGTVELTVQIIPNDDTAVSKMVFQQFEGQWRLMAGF
jgi:hypothetical protein